MRQKLKPMDMPKGAVMDDVTTRVVCLVVGYLFGMFLTADVVSRAISGKWARDVGSHNPGMANVGSLYGVKAAAITLAGDIIKTVIPCLACAALFPALGTGVSLAASSGQGGTGSVASALQPGQLALLWAGCGVVIGHNFPAWTGFKGGKGVAVTCSVVVLFNPLWGFVALVVGFVVVLATKQLCFGAGAITLVSLVTTGCLYGIGEPFWLMLFLLAMMLLKHGGPMINALHGKEPQTDLIGMVKKHTGK
jgi:glycerol-3-phosphate acyltransferase PlsY